MNEPTLIVDVATRLIHEATRTRRTYTKKEWVKKKQPRRARFNAAVLWYEKKGCNGPFYGYDFEKRTSGKGRPYKKGRYEMMECEEIALNKLMAWLHDERGKWYCISVYSCVDMVKFTGKYEDERSEYSHCIHKEVQSRNEAKRILWFNPTMEFDDDGMLLFKKLKNIEPPTART